MKLFDYIRSDRRGKEANLFEQEAMDDPFLSDALEGYDAVYGDHLDMVKRLENWVDDRSQRRRQSRRRKILGVSVAAAVVLAGTGIAFHYYSGFRPQEATVAELLEGENVKVYISGEEFLRVMETATVCGAASSIAENTGTPEPEKGDKNAKIVTLAALTADETEVASSEEIADTTTKVVAALSDNVKKEPEAVRADSANIQAVAVRSPGKEDVRVASAARQPDFTTRSADSYEAPDTVYSAAFSRFFAQNHRPVTGSDGRRMSGRIVLEFRVNDAGVPSAIKVLSSFSQDANRDAIEMLVEGPRWEPTHGRRICTVLEYR